MTVLLLLDSNIFQPLFLVTFIVKLPLRVIWHLFFQTSTNKLLNKIHALTSEQWNEANILPFYQVNTYFFLLFFFSIVDSPTEFECKALDLASAVFNEDHMLLDSWKKMVKQLITYTAYIIFPCCFIQLNPMGHRDCLRNGQCCWFPMKPLWAERF